MIQFRYTFTVLSLALILGCGSQKTDQLAENPPTDEQNSASNQPSPTDIVSLFLDEVRRGGADSRAQSLLTQRAQAELARIGHTVQPIGSPDAQFNVTRYQKVPGEKNAALVHSLWREPAADGQLQDYQVVWAVEQEPAGWRISGLAIEVSPAEPPQIIDFEDGTMMAKLLSPPSPAAQQPAGSTGEPVPETAAANNSLAR